jgi:2-aminoadipate transaminase
VTTRGHYKRSAGSPPLELIVTVDWRQVGAKRLGRMRASDIRESLKFTEKPDIISLAGGLPAPELFPVDEYRRAFEWVFETNGASALQYGVTEGYRPLRELLAERLGRRGIRCAAEDVLVTNGSQQALDLIGKVFLNPGDRVVLENPSYLGAIQAFNQYQAAYEVVPMDEDGMRVDALERILEEDRAGRRSGKIKFIYALPNFQNPTGRTLSGERRARLVELAQRFRVPIVEDDPYGELVFEGEPLPSLKSLDDQGGVIYLGTFSKILAPGFRLGWIVAAPEPLELIIYAKQPSDLFTSIATQMATYHVSSRDGYLDRHIEDIRALYRERRDAMLAAIDEHFPDGVRHTRPRGGLFVWAELPPHVDARELLLEAVQEKVAFVPGQGFHPDGSGSNTMRLNFSNVPPARLHEGIRRLGRVITRRLEQAKTPEHPVSI